MLRQIAVVSGKGGAGKTTVAASLAALAARAGTKLVLVDADADAPNLHVLFKGEEAERVTVGGPPLAKIASTAPARGGRWDDVCAFGAMSGVEVDPLRCIGCGVCELAASPNGVRMEERISGEIVVEHLPLGHFLRASLYPGETGYGGLVYRLRARGEELAMERGLGLLIADGPPGIGCPTLACISGCDLALVVAEPTIAGWHDFERICELCRKLRVPVAVCINRCDLSEMMTARIESYCQTTRVPCAGKVPGDERVMRALDGGSTVVETYPDSPASRELERVAAAVGILPQGEGNAG